MILKVIKSILSTIAVVVLAVLIVFNYQKFFGTVTPCEKPVTYSIDTFDKQFGISEEDFLHALVQAEAVWEKPIGKELFVYAPEGGELAVNLVYDYRQETTQTLSNLEGEVKEDEATYKSLQSKYVELKEEYMNLKNSYELRVDEFNKHSNAYENQVEAWNNSKRNSKEQFEELERARTALEAEAAGLKSLEAGLNNKVREVNTLVGTLNRIAKKLNLNVEAYNTIGASRGETYTGGVYYSEEGKEGINIYEFKNQDKLVRILAHELGHALGLEHVDDPKAIMYYLNEGDKDALSKTDLVSLRTLCGIK